MRMEVRSLPKGRPFNIAKALPACRTGPAVPNSMAAMPAATDTAGSWRGLAVATRIAASSNQDAKHRVTVGGTIPQVPNGRRMRRAGEKHIEKIEYRIARDGFFRVG
jgi:hypothetical protein